MYDDVIIYKIYSQYHVMMPVSFGGSKILVYMYIYDYICICICIMLHGAIVSPPANTSNNCRRKYQ